MNSKPLISLMLGLIFSPGCFSLEKNRIHLDECQVELPKSFSASNSDGLYFEDRSQGAGIIYKKVSDSGDILKQYTAPEFELSRTVTVESTNVYFFRYSIDGVSEEMLGIVSSGNSFLEIVNMDEKFIMTLAASCY